jgi:arginase
VLGSVSPMVVYYREGEPMASLGLLGVPSSSAAHWRGQEKAPGALRAGGFTALLAETGYTVIDHGDRPVVRWRPHPITPPTRPDSDA